MIRTTALSISVIVIGASLLALAADETKRRSEAKSIEGAVVRASSISGMAVKSPAGKNLGKVEDIVVDMQTGKIRYVAIGFGGFLGFGDKLFAVPFKALHVERDANASSPHFEMDVSRETLENAKGFDKKNWPNFADPRFEEENDRHFAAVTK